MRFTRDERVILVVTCLGHAVCHLGELLFPAVMVAVMGEFGLEPDQATLLAILGYVLMGAGALPVGLWADAGDPWAIHLWFFFAMAVGCVAVALAATPMALFGALTLLGLATSIYHPTALAILSLGVRRSNFAMGINGVAGSIGIALAPIVGQQARELGQWQLAYWAVAVFAGLSAVVMLVLWKYRFRMPAREAVAQEARAGGPVFPWLLLGVMVLGGFNYRCLMTALPAYLQMANMAGGAASLVLLVGCVGQLLGGKLGDRLGCRPVYLTMVLGLAPLGFGLGLAHGSSLAGVLAGGYSLLLFGLQPVENTLLAETTSSRRRSLSYGIRFVMSFGVGAVGTQVVGELWRRNGSLDGVFLVLGVSAVLMGGLLITWLVLNPRRTGETVRGSSS